MYEHPLKLSFCSCFLTILILAAGAKQILSGLSDLIEERLATRDSLLQLQGRLDLLFAQIAGRQARGTAGLPQPLVSPPQAFKAAVALCQVLQGTPLLSGAALVPACRACFGTAASISAATCCIAWWPHTQQQLLLHSDKRGGLGCCRPSKMVCVHAVSLQEGHLQPLAACCEAWVQHS